MKLVAVVFALGCGHAATKPIAVEQPTCRYGLLGMGISIVDKEPFASAQTAAQADFEAGNAAAQKDQMHDAALHFMACASRFRDVADEDAGGADAAHQADICYENALLSFEMANRYAAEGKPALVKAAADDARHADSIHDLLAKAAGDCPP